MAEADYGDWAKIANRLTRWYPQPWDVVYEPAKAELKITDAKGTIICDNVPSYVVAVAIASIPNLLSVAEWLLIAAEEQGARVPAGMKQNLKELELMSRDESFIHTLRGAKGGKIGGPDDGR